MKIEVITAPAELQHVVANLAQLYIHDFTELGGDEELDEHGRFPFPRLPDYWTDSARHPFLVRVDGKYAGFALVRRGSHFNGDPGVTDMAEFFVTRRYRRQGVGDEVARRIFDLFPGRWEVRVAYNNSPARAFWRRVVAAYADGAFEERLSDEKAWRGPVLSFTRESSPSKP